MAFPYIDQDNFEHGSESGGIWTSATDTGSKLDIAHYTTLAALAPKIGPQGLPFRGAFALRVVGGSTAAATINSTNVTQALANTGHHRFMWYAGADLAATADDIFNIMELRNNGTVEVAVSVQIESDDNSIQFGVGGAGTPVQASAFGAKFTVGQWFAIEVIADIDDDANDDGTIDLRVTPYGTPAESAVHVSQITGLDQLAITSVNLGTVNTLATTTGTMLWDEYAHDDGRLFPITSRFPRSRLVTQDSHVAIGRGSVGAVQLIDGGSGDVRIQIHDTDRGDANDASNVIYDATSDTANETHSETGLDQVFHRGCFVNLTGTNPRALVTLRKASHHCLGSVRRLGQRAPAILSQ